MKICILTPRYPFPENGGDVLRINNIARYLKSKGHELILVSFVENDAVDEQAQHLYDKVFTVKREGFFSMLYSLWFILRGRPIQCGFYHSHKFARLFNQVIQQEQPHLYISHLLRMVPYLEDKQLVQNTIVEMTDALSKTYTLSVQAKGYSWKKLIYALEKNLIKNYEKKVVNRFNKVVLVSLNDVDYLKAQVAHNDSLALHSNGVEICELNGMDYDSNKICFIGNMRTLQNQDAVLYFVQEILPLIKKEKPSAVFYIVGAQPPVSIQQLHDGENIIVTGFVDDLSATIAHSAVVVAPVRVAAGIQNKVLVAMAHSLPVVMTSLISKAIPELEHDKNCSICDNPSDFARHCLKAMKSEDYHKLLAQEGHNMVQKYYSWEEKLRGYESFDKSF